MIYVLQLNDMRGSVEILVPYAWSTDRAPLERYLAAESVEPYMDGRWAKVFRAGGPLEWCNLPGARSGIVQIPADVVNGVPTWLPVPVTELNGVRRID